MSRLGDYVRQVYLLKGHQRHGCISRYEGQFGSDARGPWMAGWYHGMVDEALDMMPCKLVQIIAEEE